MKSAIHAQQMNDLRRASVDDVDRRLVDLLSEDGRRTNADLAAVLGLAASTVHARVRALIARGVVKGFHASVDQASIGRGLQALVGVTLRPGARQENITAFAVRVRQLPQVIQVFFVAGADDFLVHIAVEGSSELREFVVEHLSGQPSVASTRTSIVFDYHRNVVAAPFE